MQAARAFEAFRRTYPEAVNAPETFYYEAQAMLALDRPEEAGRILTQLQQQYPVHPLAREARLSLGQYFYENSNYEQAQATLEQIVEEHPDRATAARALYQLGTMARAQDNLKEALRYFRRLVQEYPDTELAPDALYAVGSTQVQLERYDEAAQSFEMLGDQYPNSPHAKTLGLALANVYYELGNYERVVEEVKRRLPNVEGETRERANFLLAEAYNHLGDSENAIVYYKRFTEDNTDSPFYRPALYGLAWNYYKQDTYQWAADRFARVHAGHTDQLAEKATYYEAVNRYLANQPDEAASLYRELLQTWPNSSLADQAQYELGMIHYGQRQWEAANEAFAAVIDQHPESSRRGDAFYMRGNTFIALNSFDQALQSFDRAIALNAAPDSLKQEIIFQKAWLLYNNERFEEAASSFMDFYQSDTASDRKSDALFWGAESFFQLGNYDRAEMLFNRYLEQHPQGEHAGATRYALGWVYFRQQRYEEAARAFDRFLASNAGADSDIPYRQDARLRLADSYYALKRYPSAIRTYRQVEGDATDYALYQTGQALDLADRPQDAIKTLRQLVRQHPQSDWRDEALYRIGFINFQNQNFEAAITAYRRVIEEYPDSPLAAKAQYGVGDAQYNAGNLNQSVAAYRRVLERYPDSPFVSDAASGIQYALIALDDPDRAEAIIDSFATEHPNSRIVDELRFRLAEATYRSGQTDEALSAFRRFVRNSSDEQLLPEAYYYLGTIYGEQDRTSAAENYLCQVVFSSQNSSHRLEAAQQLGELYLDEEQYENALEVYRKMADFAEDNTDVARARYGQSQALLALNRTQDAEELLQQVVDSMPNDPAALPARLGLARVYEQQNRTQEAADLYRTVVRNAQGEFGAEALYRLGTLLLTQKQPRRAIEELSRMPTLFAGYPEWMARGYLAQARAYRQLGQSGEAVRLYDRVMQEFADTPFAQTAAKEKEAL